LFPIATHGESAAMEKRDIVVFTDGAAKGNPGPGGWGAIIVTPAGDVRELGGGEPYTTNNRMELGGAIGALEWLRGQPGRVEIHTDSTYLIQGITQWIHGWRRKGWKTASGGDVVNRELWEKLSALVGERGRENAVSWFHVRGHAGIPGNERCDEIAVAFSNRERTDLYRGPLAGYPVPVLAERGTALAPRRAGASRASGGGAPAGGSSRGGRPYSYLSVLGGVPMRHATWPDCERRVKGKAGARFKKAASREDEVAILRGWGLKGDEL
jgi:ribonuclease HI